jgi:hypothetical protein
MGVGQRVVRGAAHVGGVVVVRDAGRLREGLAAAYDPLGYRFDPDAAGSVEEEVAGVERGDVARALLEALRRRHDVEPGGLEPAVLARAGALEADHHVGA